MDKDQALATLLDQLSRAAQVIASQHRLQRDDATMARIARELRTACASCRAALPAEKRDADACDRQADERVLGAEGD